MNFTAPVSDIMSRKLITLVPGDTVEMAINLFRQHRIHHILVVRHTKLVGILSTLDINLHVNEGDGYLQQKVEDVMTTGIATLSSTDRLNVAIQLFSENLFHALPVVDNDEVVGIVTTLDIMKALTAEDDARIKGQ